MQTREQTRNWKVVASVATVAALGVSGLAVASPGEPAGNPPPIEVEDRRQNVGPAATTTTSPGFEVVSGPSFSPGDDDSLDTPLASADSADSPTQADTVDSVDSPATTTTSTTATTSTSAPDDNDSPEPDDSPESSDSPEPQDSPDDSPDDSGGESADSADSADSVDSLDS